MNVLLIAVTIFRHFTEINENGIILIYMRFIFYIYGNFRVIENVISGTAFSEKCTNHICHNGFPKSSWSGNTDMGIAGFYQWK